MYKIATLNKISPKGLRTLTDNYQIIDDPDQADGIIVRSADMHEMSFSKDLLAIARAGAGVNNIPLERCASQGIVVFNSPGANANAVKELVITGMLMASRHVPEALRWTAALKEDVKKTVEKGKSQFAGNEIKGKTLGVIGLGAIGVLVANAARQLGMKVIGYDPYISLKSAHELSNKIPVTSDMGEILEVSDFITIHVPAIDSTKGMFDARRFGQMKDGAVLLNYARDTLVNEDALLDALESGKLRYYLTDFPNSTLIGHDKVIATPHLGASTAEAEDNCAQMAAEELMEYIEKGNISNSVNYPNCSLGEMDPEANVRIAILNRNIPSMLGKITGILADFNINIRNMTNTSKGDYACTLIDIDGDEDVTAEEFLHKMDFEGIVSVRLLRLPK
ncbi:MAG: 3-phosphoglycerate dehydrogenase family protein [Anaerovoracaceae bacterium]|jgi:D-3-phosphoglycerate dehydrogenase|nr:3-phosphoglycerate dehydrogenase family protein [Anaerovoracaceae bacterium]